MRRFGYTLARQDEAGGDLFGLQYLVPQHPHLSLGDPGDAGTALPPGAEEGRPQSLPAQTGQDGFLVAQLDLVGPSAQDDGDGGGVPIQRP